MLVYFICPSLKISNPAKNGIFFSENPKSDEIRASKRIWRKNYTPKFIKKKMYMIYIVFSKIFKISKTLHRTVDRTPLKRKVSKHSF